MATAETTESTALFGHDGFAPAFAAFLRHERDWRRRRIDRFFPVDRDLATRTINLQGVIDAALVEQFLDVHGDDLGCRETALRDGDQLTVWIPAISQGKRLLLDYSIRDGQGKSLPMLNRLEAARAVAQDLLGVLVAGLDNDDRVAFAKAQDLDSFLSIFVLLAALAFQYPFALVDRVDTWIQTRHLDPDADVLEGEELRKWVRAEAASFLSRRPEGERELFADSLVSELHSLFHSPAGLEIPQQFRVGSLARFSSLHELLLHGIRDVLEVLVALCSPEARHANGCGLPSREELTRDPKRFAQVAANRICHGLGLLATMLERQTENSRCIAHYEVMSDLQRWTAYLVMEIRLGVPFQVKISETLVLRPTGSTKRARLDALLRRHGTAGRSRIPRVRLRRPHWPPLTRATLTKIRERGQAVVWRLRFRSGQLYPLALGDAEIYHVEVIADDPELGCAHGEMAAERFDERHRTKELAPCDLDEYFSARQPASDRLLHLYSTKGSREASSVDQLAQGQDLLEQTVFLRMRFPLTRSVRWGYVAAALAFLLAGAYVAGVWIEAIRVDHGPQDLKVVATVSALAVTMSLWLMRVQHPRRIVHRKVRVAHSIFALAISAIVLSPAVFGARWAFLPPAHSGKAKGKTAPNRRQANATQGVLRIGPLVLRISATRDTRTPLPRSSSLLGR